VTAPDYSTTFGDGCKDCRHKLSQYRILNSTPGRKPERSLRLAIGRVQVA